MLERSYECNKKGYRFILELFGEACVMCDVMCDVLSQPSTFQFFDAKTEMDELSFFTVRSVHAVHDAKTQP